jgi:hypothetical protein
MTTHLDYTAHLPEPGCEGVFAEFPCELVISTSVSSGDFDISILGVAMNDVDLLKSRDPAERFLGQMIIALAEADDEFTSRVMSAENIVLVGAGYNNPDSHFVRART